MGFDDATHISKAAVANFDIDLIEEPIQGVVF